LCAVLQCAKCEVQCAKSYVLCALHIYY
jgi:hypothetical protein